MSESAEVDVITITVGLFASNCHILPCPDGASALVIDPGDEPGRIIAALEERHLRPALYLLTHGHMDHVSALADMIVHLPAPVAMHPLDAGWAFTPANSAPPYYDTPRAPPRIDRNLGEGQIWNDRGIRYSIIETPGHSPGSVSFHLPDLNLLFSGDVLFAGAIGRTDLPGGHAPTLWNSLQKLRGLPAHTRLYPGHGPDTTLGEECRHNPYLQTDRWSR